MDTALFGLLGIFAAAVLVAASVGMMGYCPITSCTCRPQKRFMSRIVLAAWLSAIGILAALLAVGLGFWPRWTAYVLFIAIFLSVGPVSSCVATRHRELGEEC